MGYTHYWYRSVSLPPERWEEFLGDARRLVEAARSRGVRLAGPGAESGSDPIVTGDEVALNGVGAESCESFVIPRDFANPRRLNEAGHAFDFTKTQGRSYDLAVTAILVAAKHRFGDGITVKSDGDDPEWAAGRELCQAVLGFGSEYAIVNRWLVRRPAAPAPRTRPDPIVVREFPGLSDGRYRIRVVRSSTNSRASVILDIREFARGSSFEGYTKRGIRITSLGDVRTLREALEAIERESLLRE